MSSWSRSGSSIRDEDEDENRSNEHGLERARLQSCPYCKASVAEFFQRAARSCPQGAKGVELYRLRKNSWRKEAGVFNPRIKPARFARPLGLEARSAAISPEIQAFFRSPFSPCATPGHPFLSSRHRSISLPCSHYPVKPLCPAVSYNRHRLNNVHPLHICRGFAPDTLA